MCGRGPKVSTVLDTVPPFVRARSAYTQILIVCNQLEPPVTTLTEDNIGKYQ